MENLAHKIAPENDQIRIFPIRILVVEDDPSWQAILSYSIRKSRPDEMNLRFVRNSKQAFDLIYERKFDLIICDHYLDGNLTGFELWTRLKSQNLDIPFIIVSGKRKHQFSKLQGDSTAGLPLIIEKPFDPERFTTILNLFLSR